MKNRYLTSVFFVLFLLSLIACGEKEVLTKDEVRPIKTMRVTSPEPFGGRWYPGVAKAAQTANLSFRVAGIVDQINVNIGDEVKQGELLSRLDPQDYQVQLNDAEAQLGRALSNMDLAESEYARVARVFEKDPGAISKSLVDVRKAEFQTAKAQVTSAKAGVEKATDNLSYTYLNAPFRGIIVDRFVEQYESVQAKQEVLRLVNNDAIEFTVQVPETLMEHVDKVVDAGAAIVVFDAYPDVEIPARVSEVGKEASKTTRTYPVTLIMDQPEGLRILPGMAGKSKGNRKATAQIAKQEGLVGFEIPITATFSDEAKQTFVWVVDEKSLTVTKRAIQIVNLTENGALVTGLEPNEVIATAGANMLVEGQSVKLLD